MRRALTSSVLCLALAVGMPARADLQSEMQGLFDSMSNATPPGVLQTQRRGVLSGGGVTVANPIMSVDLVNFTPPDFEAGCGGIDFFGGSFSFINADQYVQLMRAVASNAAGYAFQIALSSMCERCMGTIETLQRKVQQLNEYFGNSCQLAQGIVNDTVSAFGGQVYTQASLIATMEGAATDVFDAFSGHSGEQPIQRAESVAPNRVQQEIRGNIVWRALVEHSTANWFLSGDHELLEVMMNITGTVILGRGSGSELEVRVIPGNANLLQTLIEGGTVDIFGCPAGDRGADGCLAPVSRTVTIDPGFRQRVEESLFGTSGTDGILQALNQAASGGTVDLTADQERMLALLPSGVGGLVLRLGHLSQPAAETFARNAAPLAAVEMARVMINDLIATVEAATSTANESHAPQVRELVRDSRQRVLFELLRLQEVYGSLPDLLAYYIDVMHVVDQSNYRGGSPLPTSLVGQ